MLFDVYDKLFFQICIKFCYSCVVSSYYLLHGSLSFMFLKESLSLLYHKKKKKQLIVGIRDVHHLSEFRLRKEDQSTNQHVSYRV